MHSISIGDLQKNISLLTQLDDILEIIDKRKNKKVAIIYPIKKQSIVASMAGKYRDKVTPCNDLQYAKNKAMTEILEKKYGLSN